MSKNKINLYFSHTVEGLADILSKQVIAQQANGSVFNAPSVMVPNANMQRFLQLTLAKINGVCAHVAFPFLETGLFQIVNQLLGSGYQHKNGSMVAWSVWCLLHDDQLMNDPVYAPINTYLSDSSAESLLAAKRWQLSQKLAKLMLDYESQRPEMVHQWLQGHCVFTSCNKARLSQLEKMQQDLYVRLFKHEDTPDSITLFQATMLLDQIKSAKPQAAIHIFTPSRLSQLHRKLLVQLGQFMNIHIYSLNVCSEYWEDLQTEQEIRWQQNVLRPYKQHPIVTVDVDGQPIDSAETAEVFFELSSFADENELLKAWGKPGREALKLFSEVEEDAIHQSIIYQDDWLIPDFSGTETLLQVVQSNVLNRSSENNQIIDPKTFNSIQFACAPSVVREVEAVYNSILWNLQQNADLVLNDIAVLVTDMNVYRFVIEQVFEELNHEHQIQLSYAIVDSSAAKESRYAEAVLDLFAVLDDDFIRASVFKWLENPCVQAGNHFDYNDWQDWLLVVDQLGIYCGFSNLYPTDAVTNDEIEVDKLFTWQQGLARLHLSLATLPNDANAVDVSAIGAERIGQLSVLLETLYQYKLRLNKKQSAIQWEQQLNQMFDLLMAVPVDDQKEQNIQMALQQSLLQLAEAQPELLLSFADIKQFITHEIQQLPASKGSYLSGGVVCAALQPMRPIPFKLTYILGLDERTFPGQTVNETLDLTQRSRRIGDINPIENNNYLLLETLMCTREKLYLSYVGMDLLKDEVIEPSPTLSTLYRYCNDLVDFSSLEQQALPMTQLPLDASESGHFDGRDLESQDWRVNYAYSDYLTWAGRIRVDWQPQSQQLSPAQQRIWQQTQEVQTSEKPVQDLSLSDLYLKQTKDKLLVDSNNALQLDATELADYLANPQAAVLKQLGVNGKHPDDRSLVEHEPLQLPSLLKYQIFTESIQQWLHQPTDLTTVIQQQHQKHLRLSQAPLAFFADLTELSKVEVALNEQLKPQLVDKSFLGVLKVGSAKSHVAAELEVDAVEVSLKSGRKVQITALAEQLYQQDGYLSDQVIISTSKKNSLWNIKLLQPFVNWCLWQLSDQVKVAEVFKVHLVFPEKVQTIEFKPWYADSESFATRSTIENYLKQLLSDYLEKPAQFLPSELLSLFKVAVKPDVPQQIPFLKKSSKAKEISYLAYDPKDMTEADIAALVEKYHKGMQWPDYEEVFKLVEVQPSEEPLAAYRNHLMPLFTMVCAELGEIKQGAKS
ncbi:exodeoxyribonuclease V subunit gamma [Marinicella litoralis]|uniref:DNA helicase/exodeoxyribonuclease V gamma subunit n=1 Tax=Marinicella litoralis TaxID=644220 RepID=A0A4R6XGF2_9GAMM|nr:exodeoxyribonuclease V subunit gamma [Marinicella litoralis]TDR18476.1 DNA helicase/exodeoxyribonuclease V gamma subunit [Marinicella litoralis]